MGIRKIQQDYHKTKTTGNNLEESKFPDFGTAELEAAGVALSPASPLKCGEDSLLLHTHRQEGVKEAIPT